MDKELNLVEYASMVHWQRDCLASIYISLDRQGLPYWFAMLISNSRLEVYRKHVPFDTALFFENGEEPPVLYRKAYKEGMDRRTFLRSFDQWFEKANLGYTPAGERVKMLPLLADEKQLFTLREVLTPNLYEIYFEYPVRLFTTLAAYENDCIDMQGLMTKKCGKHTYTQLLHSLGHTLPREASALQRALTMLEAYNTLVKRPRI